ncbi:hypothetical protein KVT40_008435 [Elsinoe batatas]|uniref:Uncharacterized protein n=1 Tax=Elsinoe batatas TaxID=2601811 RepID=A0A8K0PFD6_9PEZI|nr:hypothetical protein KVT40_008435 [Elsinoe batatas]
MTEQNGKEGTPDCVSVFRPSKLVDAHLITFSPDSSLVPLTSRLQHVEADEDRRPASVFPVYSSGKATAGLPTAACKSSHTRSQCQIPS